MESSKIQCGLSSIQICGRISSFNMYSALAALSVWNIVQTSISDCGKSPNSFSYRMVTIHTVLPASIVSFMNLSRRSSVNFWLSVGSTVSALFGKRSMLIVFVSGEMEAPVKEYTPQPETESSMLAKNSRYVPLRSKYMFFAVSNYSILNSLIFL